MSGRPPSPTGRRAPVSQTGRDFYDYPPSSRTTRDYVSAGSRDHGDGPRLVTIRQRSPPRRPRDDDYQDLPRIRTNSLEPGASASRRLDAYDSRSPTKITRPVIIRDSERPPSPISKTGGAQLEASFLIPASSSRHHHRHSSFNGGERLSTRDRERDRERERERDRERSYPLQYGPGSSLAPIRPAKESRDYESSSTLAPPQRRVRSGSHTGARPTSMIEFDRGDKLYARTDRDAPPPSSTRGFETVNRKDSLRSGNRDLGDDLARRDSLSQRYYKDERADPKYRDMPPRTHKSSRDDYVVYPPENTRQHRPRQPTLESDSEYKRTVTDYRDDRDSDRSRRHRHHKDDNARDYDERHDRHRRRDYDDREENVRRREYDDRGEKDRDRERRRDYEDKHDKDPRSGHGEKEDRERRKQTDYRDDRERRREYDDKDYRSKDELRESDRRSEQSSSDGLLAAGGAAAAAGLAAEGVRRHRNKDDDAVPSRDRRSSFIPDRDRDRDRDRDLDRPPEAPRPPVPALTEEEEREERRRRRRRLREQDDHSAIDDSSDDREERKPLQIEAAPPPPGEHTLREQKSYERRASDANDEEPGRRRRRRRRRHHRSPSNDAVESHSSSESDSSTEARAPRILSPPPAADLPSEPPAPRPAPKGILKRPKVAFPEDNLDERAGVAPSDAAKKNIPKEARWTRINRKLVNPEALESEGLRFEEFSDHVVVLKVLNKDEIDYFARRTHEIRERRRIEGGSQAGSGSGDGDGSELPPVH